MNHDEISKVSSVPCHFRDVEEARAKRRSRTAPLHTHENGAHAHDGRPHVHLPDGTIHYLTKDELPSAPKRRRGASPTKNNDD